MRFTKRQIEEIKALYLDGVSTIQIAEKYNRSPNIIWDRLKRSGVVIRRQRFKVSDSEVKRIIELYQGGKTMLEIAKGCGCSDKLVHRILVTKNITIRSARETWALGRGRELGRIKVDGYILLRKPASEASRGWRYILEHRLVWEQYNGKLLPEGWAIHHLNGIKDDNRPENLLAVPSKMHGPSFILKGIQNRLRQVENELRQLKSQLPFPNFSQ